MKNWWLVLLVLSACAPAQLSADLYNRDGAIVGSANFTHVNGAVLVSIDARALPPGLHALHIHEFGVCEGAFNSAGAHFNPTDKKHGHRNPEGYHLGDLGNVNVDEFGDLKTEILVQGIGLVRTNPIYNRSIILHESADDEITDPSGNAGARIVCGVIR